MCYLIIYIYLFKQENLNLLSDSFLEISENGEVHDIFFVTREKNKTKKTIEKRDYSLTKTTPRASALSALNN
jgi:hypothetical protein